MIIVDIPGSALSVLDLDTLKREAMEEALRRTGGHIARAARLLGCGEATLYRHLYRLRPDLPRRTEIQLTPEDAATLVADIQKEAGVSE